MATSHKNSQDSSPIELHVKNFGPIASADIELRPLTVFVGPSNTGKSYLAILLYALHRIFSGSYQGIQNTFRRKVPRKNSYSSPFHDQYWRLRDQTLTKKNQSNIIEWAIQLKGKNNKKKQSYEILPPSVASIVYRKLNAANYPKDEIFSEIVRCFGVNDISEVIRHSSRNATISITKNVDLSEKPFEFNMSISSSSNSFNPVFPEENQLQLNMMNIKNDFNWTRTLREIEDDITSDQPDSSKYIASRILRSIVDNIFAEIISPFHLLSHYFPASRTGVVEASHAIQGALYDRISRAGIEPINVPLLSGIIADFLPKMDPDFLSRSNYHRNPFREYANKMEEKVVEGRVLIEDLEGSNPAFYFQQGDEQNSIGKPIPLTIASSMVTELAPIILHLRYLIDDSNVLIIEEPEAHLHPAKQVEFTRQLASLVKKGIRIIITTHSEWVLEALTNIVQISDLSSERRKDLPSGEFFLEPDQVGVWLFKSKNSPKGSIVKPININNKSDAFPADYDETMEALYNEWAETANRKEEDRNHGFNSKSY